MPKYEIILTLSAIEEIQNTIIYYNDQQKGLGKRFYSDLKKRFSAIHKNPYICAIRYDDIRFAMLDKFPYAAHYNIEDSAIVIWGVLSTHLDPNTSWIRKK